MSLMIFKSPRKIQAFADSLRAKGKIIGLVPTMGAIHAGHLKLVDMAVRKSDYVIASIFVNPTQFGPKEDLSKYPRAFKSDCRKLEKAGAKAVFHPSVNDMYPDGYSTYVDVGEMTTILEGARRPGHFRGVATVCAKLFNITKPHIAVFGQKDGQQLAVIRRMVRDLNFDLKIIRGPIVSTSTGVALSSRHSYLSPEGLEKARVIRGSLKLAEKMLKGGIRNSRTIKIQMRDLIEAVPGVTVDYISINRWDDLQPVGRIYDRVMISLVVVIEKVRLLDNIIINVK
jgi:pantoate--beta-alanine ligase